MHTPTPCCCACISRVNSALNTSRAIQSRCALKPRLRPSPPPSPKYLEQSSHLPTEITLESVLDEREQHDKMMFTECAPPETHWPENSTDTRHQAAAPLSTQQGRGRPPGEDNAMGPGSYLTLSEDDPMFAPPEGMTQVGETSPTPPIKERYIIFKRDLLILLLRSYMRKELGYESGTHAN